MQINQQMMKMKMLMTAALMMTAAAAYAGDNVLPSWALGGFVRPQGVNPLVSPIADSRFLCPMTGESVKWECADTFNPAAVGYVVAAVSWPEQVFRYPQPYTSIPLWDASMVPVSSTIEDTLRSGGMLNIRSLVLSLGEYAAPMGTGAALVILACGLFLWTQKDAHMSASVSFLLTCALIAFLFPRQAGLADSAVLANVLPRLRCVRDELLTGAILFSAVFLLNEPYTCVHHRMGRILYGVLVGAATMGFRYFGVYDTGVCFALLTVNSISGWLDRTETRLYRLLGWKEDAE